MSMLFVVSSFLLLSSMWVSGAENRRQQRNAGASHRNTAASSEGSVTGKSNLDSSSRRHWRSKLDATDHVTSDSVAAPDAADPAAGAAVAAPDAADPAAVASAEMPSPSVASAPTESPPLPRPSIPRRAARPPRPLAVLEPVSVTWDVTIPADAPCMAIWSAVVKPEVLASILAVGKASALGIVQLLPGAANDVSRRIVVPFGSSRAAEVLTSVDADPSSRGGVVTYEWAKGAEDFVVNYRWTLAVGPAASYPSAVTPSKSKGSGSTSKSSRCAIQRSFTGTLKANADVVLLKREFDLTMERLQSFFSDNGAWRPLDDEL